MRCDACGERAGVRRATRPVEPRRHSGTADAASVRTIARCCRECARVAHRARNCSEMGAPRHAADSRCRRRLAFARGPTWLPPAPPRRLASQPVGVARPRQRRLGMRYRQIARKATRRRADPSAWRPYRRLLPNTRQRRASARAVRADPRSRCRRRRRRAAIRRSARRKPRRARRRSCRAPSPSSRRACACASAIVSLSAK